MELTRTIRDKMMNEHLMFVYRGVVTSENSVPLLMLLEKEMENSEFGFVGRKRLFMFVLESLQNVSRHNRNSAHANMSMVVYSKTPGGYTVTTGNVLQNSGINDLKKRLEEINNLENKEIRNVYRQMLSSAEFSTKGGAGLGLIEMAKKTGNKLDYDFVPLDDEHSYFVLSKTVDSGGLGSHHPNEYVFHGEAIMQLERIMAENNLYLIWSGHISPDIGKEVISFTETRLTENEIASNLRKRVFSILVEILENVSKYSPGKESEEQFGMPLAMLSLDGKIYSLTTGNLILNSKVPDLREKLDNINRYDKTGLKEAFRKSLSIQSAESDSTGNMGLIDMARKSGSKLEYKFEEISELFSYYTLTVKVEDRQND
ncbi:MAG TPA: SiaB family protein kinase [Bacteroidales bacterium]|nr:SiaB family protein kinase [Bacteroidales bacterium]